MAPLRWQRACRAIAVLLSLWLAVAIAGCGDRTPTAAVSQLVFSIPSDPTTFNAPLNDSLYSRYVLRPINEGLIDIDGLTGEVIPALAESWEISDDRLRIIFTLREGLQWSDGEPLTASDVVFSYDKIYLNEKIPIGVRDILRIGESGTFPAVRKLDDRRVEFAVPEPFAPFLRFAGGLYILPEHVLASSLEDSDAGGNLKYLSTWTTGADPRTVIGAGPYRIVRYVPSQRTILERNPYYWRKGKDGEPQPYIERLVVQTIESADNQLIAFRTGDLDILSVSPKQFRLLKREEARGGYTIYNGGPVNSKSFLTFNLNRALDENGTPFVDPVKQRWFQNKAFRQAVAYAIDREQIKNTTYRGLGAIQHSPIVIQSPFYLSPEEGLKTYSYDPERAHSLLTNAGFQYDADGLLFDADGNRVRFRMLVTRPDSAVQIVQDLEAIGIRTDLQVLQFNAMIKKLDRRDWDTCLLGFGGGSLDPHGGFNVWYSGGSLHTFNQGPIPGQPPIQGWEVSDWEREIDRLFIAGVGELDEEKRKAIYGEFQQIVAEQVPFIYLINPLSLSAIRDRIQNIKYTALDSALWNLYELDVEPE
ncbi:ABC-type dipeptide transport system, periplasmic component [Rubidibacter lacunae KORDI 51-2]|uniref:ABC-type dipeptide transport system, periplasmic component n=1 Tax=Rubidibacter lacunae KORDI 51-2 TaxID=582515 RepID=U5DNP9_9CHRO|nr:ABC transporter substrate-binding protein [Rubidibacter lacunae]ERN42492.1 ABC-type dipeptide transport system, periplasmic component [Rubidibacter lacunae KORDI 51-2]